MLTAEEIRMSLTRPRSGAITVEEELASTNRTLKEQALAGAGNGRVLIARRQTAGRGRLGRSFLSEEGKGLYYSMLLRPGLDAEKLLPLTGLCAVAAARAVDSAGGVSAGVKWVNDILLHGKKLGGILTELVLPPEGGCPAAVVGIGINLSYTAEDFEAAGLAGIATSFAAEGVPVDPALLAARLTEALDDMAAALVSGETAAYTEEYRRRCVTLRQPVRILYPAGPETGTALDIDDRFGLLVEKQTGERTVIRSGEVSVRGYYGYV